MEVTNTILSGLSWAGVGFLIFLLWRIARFYERSSGENACSWLFLIPLVLLPLGAFWYLVEDPRFVESRGGDVLFFSGGLVLLIASILLQQAMMGER